LERVFDQFHQVEDHLTRKAGGMGLGLSIAQAIVNAQGGRIWAESPGPDQGSTLFIAMPAVGQTGTLATEEQKAG
jgi:signal transduction histidine kinase